MPQAILALEDGLTFRGESVGATGSTEGEVVFNTAMTGYQEILTDPSYRGQIVLMTYPQIGNYGVNEEDVESRQPFLSGFIMREASVIASNWRSTTSLQDYLARWGIVGIAGIDTRELTRHLRDYGAQRGIISTEVRSEKTAVKRADTARGIVGIDLVTEVTCARPWTWKEPGKKTHGSDRSRKNIAVYDFGVKYNILRQLAAHQCDLRIYPARTPASRILQSHPDGVFLSNGPGDPEAVPYAIEAVQQLIGKIPLFGICLGHQILALASGADIVKLKFGHHGANHPVQNLRTREVEITSQNHGFAVVPESLDRNGLELTHLNLNDRTVEGMRNTQQGFFSVQYHPEASPGPHDSHYLFQEFMDLMETGHA